MADRVYTEKVLGIDILSWSGWDEVGDDWLQFYECEFFLPELEKYNETKPTVALDRNGYLRIFSDDNSFIEVNVGSLKSFRDRLNSLDIVEDISSIKAMSLRKKKQ